MTNFSVINNGSVGLRLLSFLYYVRSQIHSSNVSKINNQNLKKKKKKEEM